MTVPKNQCKPKTITSKRFQSTVDEKVPIFLLSLQEEEGADAEY